MAMNVILFHLILGLVPDDIKDKLKSSEIGRKLNIEQKMGLREKQKA